LAYFQRIEGFAATRSAYTLLFEALDIARSLGPAGAARARALQAAIFELERREQLVSRATAQRADAFIRTHIASSSTGRPRRPASRSGDMAGNVRSDPLAGTLPLGQVGIANLELMARTVNPDAPGAGEYWRAQEYGTTAHIGRRLVGYFQPGGAPPNEGDFRAHAYFDYDGRSNKKAPGGIIRRPIQPRHFLRDGTADAVGYWREQQRRVERDVVSALRRL
jgi:hypothetical protein